MSRYKRTTEGAALDRPSERNIGRFMQKIDFRNCETDPYCWLWAGTFRRDDRYGIFNLQLPDGTWRCVHAHRLSFAIFNDGVPAGFDVHHICVNHACVNPIHLELAHRGCHNGEKADSVPF